MSELRKDPITGTWCIVATERGKRPRDFACPVEEKKEGTCPFCPGNEHLTPPEVMAYREEGTGPDRPGWRVRVVPNKYPALRPDMSLEEERKGPYEWMNGAGAHEVLIETPSHDATLATMPQEQLESVFRALRQRYRALARDHRLEYLQIFKNSGATAGASLEHPHFQLVATPMVPPAVRARIEGAARYMAEEGECILCALTREEKARGERLVEETDLFVGYCPFASRFPYETRVVPKAHVHDFGLIDDRGITDLVNILRRIMSRLESAFACLPYNLVLQTAPYREDVHRHYHWYLEILPRLATTAGFEWGSGCYIVPTAPEFAARSLRETGVKPA